MLTLWHGDYDLLCNRSQLVPTEQSQKTQGVCVVNFGTLSDERGSRSEIVLLFNTEKEPCVRKFEGLAPSKILGISQAVKLKLVQLT